ncbi:MAG: helix-turn-helix transcriptional regulator [Clostridia bacterium]|nr:helix-turn-helix transcriptional regulator [Clostridia bacterium]
MKVFIRIRDLREDHDLSQRQIAALLGITQAQYNRYEQGHRDLPTRILIQLAELFNTSIDYLLGLTDEPTPYPPSKFKSLPPHG